MRKSHGKCKTKAYRTWQNMKGRCYYPSSPSYKKYGAKGITVCSEWLNSFEAFYKDMGDPPTERHTIDRIDSEKGYYRENCRWATYIEQNNNLSNNHKISFQGKTMSVCRWQADRGFSQNSLHSRLVRGWPVAEALTTPLRHKLDSPVTYSGKTQKLAAWEAETGIPRLVLYKRLKRGWSLEKTFTKAVRKQKNLSLL